MTHPVPDNPIMLQKRQRFLLAFFACFLMLFYLLPPVAPQRWNDLYVAYGRAAIAAMAGIYFFFNGFRGKIEVRLVLYYTLWFFVSRLLNTDYYLQNELDLVIARLLCCVILPLGLLLEPAERELLLDVVIAVAGAFYFISALIGLYACIFGIYFYLPPEQVAFGLDNDFLGSGFIYVVAWETNRTISAVWFYLAWCMMAYEFFHCKNRLWRIPICIAWFVFHLTIAFCFCRTIKLVVCVNAAMLAILGALKLFRSKGAAAKVLLAVLLAALSFFVTYKSFEVLNKATAAVYNAADIQIERTSDVFIGERYKERNKDGQLFLDTRDMAESVSTVSNRSDIYRSVLPTLRAEPLRILIGKYSDKMMDTPRRFMNYPYFHMHNIWLQVLMLTGLPGLLPVLAFSLLLVWRMLRLFFSQNPEAGIAVKCLTLPLSGVLLYGLFETMLFTQCADGRANTDFRELFFFLVAGIVLAYSYELAPPKKRK